MVTGSRADCVGPNSRLVSAVNGSGYLSSVVADRTGVVGTADCPWLLRAGPGQRITLSLLDFSAAVAAGGQPPASPPSENDAAPKLPPSSRRCLRLAVVREPTRAADREVCSAWPGVGDGARERTVYLSESNEVEVAIEGRRRRQHGVDISSAGHADDDDTPIFLLRYNGKRDVFGV